MYVQNIFDQNARSYHPRLETFAAHPLQSMIATIQLTIAAVTFVLAISHCHASPMKSPGLDTGSQHCAQLTDVAVRVMIL